MKKSITLVNADDLMASTLQQEYQIVDEISEHMFIDWHKPKQHLDQINALERAIESKSNVVLFDRFLSLKQHEITWLMRYKNVKLFEPCLITRMGFKYMPFWYQNTRFTTNLDKSIDIGIVPDESRDNIRYEYDIPEYDSYSDVNMTVVFCSEQEYNKGYLPNIRNILEQTCVPLLPGKHKYFWKLFAGLVVNNKKDLDWCVNVLRMYDALVFGIYDNMEKFFPEMLVENVVSQIKGALEGDE